MVFPWTPRSTTLSRRGVIEVDAEAKGEGLLDALVASGDRAIGSIAGW